MRKILILIICSLFSSQAMALTRDYYLSFPASAAADSVRVRWASKGAAFTDSLSVTSFPYYDTISVNGAYFTRFQTLWFANPDTSVGEWIIPAVDSSDAGMYDYYLSFPVKGPFDSVKEYTLRNGTTQVGAQTISTFPYSVAISLDAAYFYSLRNYWFQESDTFITETQVPSMPGGFAFENPDSGYGDNVIQIRVRDTSGVDEYVNGVWVTFVTTGVASLQGKLPTPAGASAVFTLLDGTYQITCRKPGYQFLPDTITVTGDTSLIMDGYNISNANVATVYGCMRDLGMATGRAYVGISMPERKRNGCDSTLLLSNVIKEVLTDSVGCFSFDNIPWSSCFGGSKYKLTVRPATTTAMNLFSPAQAPRDFPVSVPDSISYQVTF